MLISPARGGVAARSRKAAKPLFDAQTGWSEMFLTTPSAPIKGCLRQYFLEVASTPPLEEGTSSSSTISPFGNTAFVFTSNRQRQYSKGSLCYRKGWPKPRRTF